MSKLRPIFAALAAVLLCCSTALAQPVPPAGSIVPGAPLDFGSYTPNWTGAATRYLQSRLQQQIYADDFVGTYGDTQVSRGTVSISLGSSSLTLSSAPFTSADVGKTIVVPGAGAGAFPLVTTIQAYNAANSVTLAATASTSVAAAKRVAWGHPDDVGLQTALAQAAKTGGAVNLSCKNYMQTQELTINTSNVYLSGCGVGIVKHNGTAGSGTTAGSLLVWAGAQGGTQMFVGSPDGGIHTSNSGVTGVMFDASSTLADISLQIRTVSFGKFAVGYLEPNLIGMDIGTQNNQLEWSDNQWNDFWIEGYQSLTANTGARGIDIDGQGTGGQNNGNTSLNHFHNILIETGGAANGIHIGNTDHNLFDITDVFWLGGTGTYALELDGSNSAAFGGARYEFFNYLNTGANGPILAKGTSSYTYASFSNQIARLDTANQTPSPTIEAGATLWWGTGGQPTIGCTTVAGSGCTGGGVAANVHDGSNGGGNTLGAGAVDLVTIRSLPQYSATGNQSGALWGQNVQASGQASAAGGNLALAQGTSSQAWGTQVTATGYGKWAYASGGINGGGTSQEGKVVFRGSTSTTSGTVRLTADGGASATTGLSSNCLPIPANSTFGLDIFLKARDQATSSGNVFLWHEPAAIMTMKATASTGTYTASGSAVTTTSGTVTGAAVTPTFDTTAGCLSLVWTHPSSDSDLYYVTAVIKTVE